MKVKLAALTIHPSYVITLLGDSGNGWTVQVPSGTTVSARNTALINSTAIGGAVFNSFTSSGCFDGGGNTGWNFEGTELNTITSSLSDSGGNIIPLGAINVARGSDQTFNISALAGYLVSDVLVDSVSQGVIESYTFDNVITDHTISVVTNAIITADLVATAGDECVVLTWGDVPEATSYNLYWSVEPGVTKASGTLIENIFSPFTHDDLMPGTQYYYALASVVSGLEQDLGTETSAIPTGDFYPIPFSWNSTTTAYYISLLTSEYQLSENIKDFLTKPVSQITSVMNAANVMDANFDLDYAKGPQLDILGQIIGFSRVLPFEPSDGSGSTIDDTLYRQLLKATIAMNQWDGKIGSIESQWVAIFPGMSLAIKDNQDMSMTLTVSGKVPIVLQEIIEAGFVVPRPQAVQLNYSWFVANKLWFAYDINNNIYTGYNKGYWQPLP